jgi:hypothetical protein
MTDCLLHLSSFMRQLKTDPLPSEEDLPDWTLNQAEMIDSTEVGFKQRRFDGKFQVQAHHWIFIVSLIRGQRSRSQSLFHQVDQVFVGEMSQDDVWKAMHPPSYSIAIAGMIWPWSTASLTCADRHSGRIRNLRRRFWKQSSTRKPAMRSMVLSHIPLNAFSVISSF